MRSLLGLQSDVCRVSESLDFTAWYRTYILTHYTHAHEQDGIISRADAEEALLAGRISQKSARR